MKNEIIGRKSEISEIRECISSGKSEFVVVYGRRRVGKTYLIRKYFKDTFSFCYVGKRNVSKTIQLKLFADALQEQGKLPFIQTPRTWFEAFGHLQKMVETQQTRQKKVIFIDEMPWMDTPKSNFVEAIENFWNSWAANRDDIVLIVCGSATSWMVDKVLHNQGGLFSRVTRQLYLRPFTLAEVEEYLIAHGFAWDRYQIVMSYMVFGGIPYYLTLLNKGQSLSQNIDRLFFSGVNAIMRTEFDELYQALFKHPENYLTVVETLCGRREGMSRQEISDKTKLGGATLTKILSDLERCDFIFSYNAFGVKKNNAIYRVKDFYTLFYYKFIRQWDRKNKHFWVQNEGKPATNSWKGLTFEMVCLLHLDAIKKRLGVSVILTESTTWRSKNRSHPLQIDLVIKRADRTINLCEIKFSDKLYMIDKNYEKLLVERKSLFAAETQTRYATTITFVTTYGILHNSHAGVIGSTVTMDDLFEPA